MTGRLSRDTGPIVELARARERERERESRSVAIVIPASVRSHARARVCMRECVKSREKGDEARDAQRRG